MLNEYEIYCPDCAGTEETTEISVKITRWTDMSLELTCHCADCDATWKEHFVFPRGSYEGYTFNGKEYDGNGKEIETYE